MWEGKKEKKMGGRGR